MAIFTDLTAAKSAGFDVLGSIKVIIAVTPGQTKVITSGKLMDSTGSSRAVLTQTDHLAGTTMGAAAAVTLGELD